MTLNLRSGPLQLAATALILVSPFTKFALTLEPVAQGVDKFLMSKVGSWLLHNLRSLQLNRRVTGWPPYRSVSNLQLF